MNEVAADAIHTVVEGAGIQGTVPLPSVTATSTNTKR